MLEAFQGSWEDRKYSSLQRQVLSSLASGPLAGQPESEPEAHVAWVWASSANLDLMYAFETCRYDKLPVDDKPSEVFQNGHTC